jgi:cytochrome c-type biogenesis protein CcmE
MRPRTRAPIHAATRSRPAGSAGSVARDDAIAGAVVYLGAAAARSNWVYYLDVDRFVEQQRAGAPDGDRVRLHGTVALEGFEVSAADMCARFKLVGEGDRLPVEYRGVVPDLLAPGREVVVEGAAEAGIFRADVLMTKCGSKYESEGRGSQPAPGQSR